MATEPNSTEPRVGPLTPEEAEDGPRSLGAYYAAGRRYLAAIAVYKCGPGDITDAQHDEMEGAKAAMFCAEAPALWAVLRIGVFEEGITDGLQDSFR